VATDEFERLSLDNEIKDLEEEASEAEEAFDTVNVEEAKDELEYESGLRIKFWKATFPTWRAFSQLRRLGGISRLRRCY
jgi:hypothetical protein